MSTYIVGWAHSPFGRLDQFDLEALITGVTRDAIADAGIAAKDIDAMWLGNLNGGFVPDIFCSSMHVLSAMQLCGMAGAMQVPNASLAGIFNMGGSAVASYVSVLERVR